MSILKASKNISQKRKEQKENETEYITKLNIITPQITQTTQRQRQTNKQQQPRHTDTQTQTNRGQSMSGLARQAKF